MGPFEVNEKKAVKMGNWEGDKGKYQESEYE